MDWATEIADNMADGWEGFTVYDTPSPNRNEIAAALRKAKADGVRSAVKLLKEAERNLDKTKPGYLPNVGLLGNLEIIFGWKIDKLETPTD